MRCRKVRSFLLTYCKGELTEKQTAKVKLHLEKCAGCRREEETIRSINKLMPAIPQMTVSEDFNARLFQRIGQEGSAKVKSKAYFPGRIPLLGSRRLAVVATMAVMVMALGIGLNFSGNILGTAGPGMAVTSPEGTSAADENLYLTVQPTDNPFLNQQKTVADMVKQYNRWRQYSQALRTHTGSDHFFFNQGGATLTSSGNIAQPSGWQTIRIRPVIRNYLIVPENNQTFNGSGTY